MFILTIFIQYNIRSPRHGNHIRKRKKQNPGFQFKIAEWKDMCLSPPVRAPKLQLAVEQPLIGGHWNQPKKDTHIQIQGKSHVRW